MHAPVLQLQPRSFLALVLGVTTLLRQRNRSADPCPPPPLAPRGPGKEQASGRQHRSSGKMSSYDRPPSADRPRKKRSEHKKRSTKKKPAGPEPEHRRLAKQLKELEAQGKKNSSQYKKIALDHRNALSSALREIGCDLTDAELRGLNRPDAEGEVPLHKVVYEYFALQQGAKGSTQRSRMDACVTKARALCEAGARVDHRNKYGDTPLLAAAQTDAAEIASVLLEYGADLTAKNRQGYAPLLMAASENRPAAVAVLTPEMVARRKSLDDRSGGYAALHWCCINDAPQAVKILLQHKADKNLRTDPTGTPLMKAAAYNAAACVELLLRARCDATATDNDGRTALHHAAKNKATLCAQMLLASGVPADVVDHHNQKAIFYAAVARSKPCVAAISASIPNSQDARCCSGEIDGEAGRGGRRRRFVGQGGCFGVGGVLLTLSIVLTLAVRDASPPATA